MAKNQNTPRVARSCKDLREGLSAMIDGEADKAEVMALRAHLRDCRECEAYFETLSILHIRLREELSDPTDPETIWWGVSARLDGEDTRRETARAARIAGARRWAPLAAAAMVLLAVFVGSTGDWMRDFSTLPVVSETNRDFETFRVSGRPLDVAAKEPGRIRQWMANRLDFDLPPDMAGPRGFRLAGGRLCSFLNRRLAFFQYEKGDLGLSLYVMKGAGLALPDPADLATIRASQGVTTVVWQHNGLVYLAVSELPEREVEALARGLIERVGEPGAARSSGHRRPLKFWGASRA